MNFLAHILLSGENEGVIMGNYVGDFIKGWLTPEKTADWNPNYVLGLKLHRHIDSFTDTHPLVLRAKEVASEEMGKLAGIAMDVYFDYFLAKDFSRYHRDPLFVFAHDFYTLIERNEHLVPQAMVPMVNAMVRQDWLTTYATIEGIDLTFRRMSRRAEFLQPLVRASGDLVRNEAVYHEYFLAFFPDLQQEAHRFLTDNTL